MAELNYPHNPVYYDGSGELVLNDRKLQEFCNSTVGNFTSINAELATLRYTHMKLVQFMNWLAVTNPQILDEFQTTSNAFEKLAPRDSGGPESACASA